jgi:hypothetical protein
MQDPVHVQSFCAAPPPKKYTVLEQMSQCACTSLVLAKQQRKPHLEPYSHAPQSPVMQPVCADVVTAGAEQLSRSVWVEAQHMHIVVAHRLHQQVRLRQQEGLPRAECALIRHVCCCCPGLTVH